MSFFSKLFGQKSNDPPEDEPFMEHPTGEFKNSLEAMTSAFKRLNTGSNADRWITFSGQGKGHDEDSDQIEDVRVRGNTFDLHDQNIDVAAVLQFAGLQGQVTPQTDAEGMITLPDATPEQLARFLDGVFRKHFGIQPHEGEPGYAVGAEW
jgi:hypothetical protein